MTPGAPAPAATAPARVPLTGASQAVALEVLLRGPVSRSELARRLGLSPGSLTRLARPLLHSGLLVEAGIHYEPRTGRPSRPLDIVADAYHFVGVKLTGAEAHAVVTTLRADVVAARRLPLADRDPVTVVDTVRRLVDELRSAVPRVTALGVSVGGRTAGRRVLTAPFLGWAGELPLGRMLDEATGLPTVVDNDVLALTKAEHWFGAGRGYDRFAVLTIGAGVGYGLVVHNEIVDSPDAGIGLVGHYPLDPVGPLCDLGHRGCAAAMLAIPRVCAWAAVGLGRTVSYTELLDLADAGDPVAARVTHDAGLALGRLIAAVANLTMVRKVVLSGEGIRLATTAAGAVAGAVAAGIDRDRDHRASTLDLDVRAVGFDEWARGAAVSAIQAYLRRGPDAGAPGAGAGGFRTR